MKKKRKKDEDKAYFKYQKMTLAGYIRDRYPDVESIEFTFAYKDPDNLCPPHSQHYIKKPDAVALFEFDCPNRECVDGGHDITDIVNTTIINHQKECSGQLDCQGWSDSERIGQYRCLYELKYRVTINYKTSQ